MNALVLCPEYIEEDDGGTVVHERLAGDLHGQKRTRSDGLQQRYHSHWVCGSKHSSHHSAQVKIPPKRKDTVGRETDQKRLKELSEGKKRLRFVKVMVI